MWDAELPRELARARRGETPICIAVLDLDHLGAFNMLRGEREGDRLLKEAAAAGGRGGLLDQPVALALALQHVERAEVVEVEDRDRDRVLAAPGARELARQLLVEDAPGRDAGELVGQRERLHSRAQAGVVDGDGGLGGEQAQHTRRPLRHGLDRQLPDHDQHAGDLAVAQHRLEQRRAGARSRRPAAGRAPGASARRSTK